MKYCCVLAILLFSCGEKNNNTSTAGRPVSNDTVPIVRRSVSKKPVASYWVVMNEILDRKFGVDVYETPNTFKYFLSMQYDGMVQTDTLEVPNFGMWPEIRTKPGEQKLSCIIGFMDTKKEFREYKLLSAKNNKLVLSTLKYYAEGRY